jgi:hypothetical protein
MSQQMGCPENQRKARNGKERTRRSNRAVRIFPDEHQHDGHCCLNRLAEQAFQILRLDAVAGSVEKDSQDECDDHHDLNRPRDSEPGFSARHIISARNITAVISTPQIIMLISEIPAFPVSVYTYCPI